MSEDVWQTAITVGDEVVAYFSEKHPGITMNWEQWSDLREMITREVVGQFSDLNISAKELMK